MKLLGGKVGRGSKKPSLSPSIGHQAKNLLLFLPLATKQKTLSFSIHWPPSKKPSPFPSIGHHAKNLLLFLPLATKQKTFSFSFHWPPSKKPSPSPSIGHQAKNLLLFLPLATKQKTFSVSVSFLWPLSFGSTFTFLLLLFKRRTQMIGGLSFPGHNFQFNLENTCSYKLLEEEKYDQPWNWEEEG